VLCIIYLQLVATDGKRGAALQRNTPKLARRISRTIYNENTTWGHHFQQLNRLEERIVRELVVPIERNNEETPDCRSFQRK
jgi:hypothetical protein